MTISLIDTRVRERKTKKKVRWNAQKNERTRLYRNVQYYALYIFTKSARSYILAVGIIRRLSFVVVLVSVLDALIKVLVPFAIFFVRVAIFAKVVFVVVVAGRTVVGVHVESSG